MPALALPQLQFVSICLLGTLDQYQWPDGSETPLRPDVDYLKRAGFNMTRKHNGHVTHG